MIPAEIEFLAGRLLQKVLFVAEGAHVLPGFQRGKFGWCAVLIGRADEKDFMAARLFETGENVGRQHRADQRAQMLDAVDIRQCRGDQNPFHVRPLGQVGDTREIMVLRESVHWGRIAAP